MALERKQELIQELQDARLLAGVHRHGLVQTGAIVEHVKEGVSKFRSVWLSLAVLLGLVIAKLPPRTKKIVVRRGNAKVEQEIEKAGKLGLGMTLVKMVFDFAKPFLMAWANRWVKQRLTDRPLR